MDRPLAQRIRNWYRRSPSVARHPPALDPADSPGAVPSPAGTCPSSGTLSTTISDSSEATEATESVHAEAVSLGPDGPAESPTGIATTSDTSASGTDPGAPVDHPSPHRPDSDGDDEAVGMTAPAAISGPTNGDIASATHGCWLPLREAVREVGSLEHLYRLARDGKLPSRDDADGRIEVWITDADRSDAALAGSLEARLARDGTLPSRPEATGSVEPSVASEQVTSAITSGTSSLRARTAP